MITPNKVISLRESALGRIAIILKLQPKPSDLLQLYHELSDHFESIDQFIVALDILFALGEIEIDTETRIISYAR